ncbi:hypothetical protein JAAARDRAFT_50799 [Jaapia argillacea MUCL 33604]|uniref:Uncharacterized protein n=1 Tax=Jaapia argillacea MUCL 33604 TaxID=933084 RepID=A0A067PK52_9AGAM|nr:hypothetical protein JAAARDRAFT_50799 [Jaapia argillacea MUCL 33604]
MVPKSKSHVPEEQCIPRSLTGLKALAVTSNDDALRHYELNNPDVPHSDEVLGASLLGKRARNDNNNNNNNNNYLLETSIPALKRTKTTNAAAGPSCQIGSRHPIILSDDESDRQAQGDEGSQDSDKEVHPKPTTAAKPTPAAEPTATAKPATANTTGTKPKGKKG